MSLRKRKTVKRNSHISSSSDEEDNINTSIEAKAARNHLTVNNVRSIIKNVVSNEFVLKTVWDKAEQLTRMVEEGKEKFTENLLRDLPEGKRMTRNVSRQLNRSSLPILDLNAITPDEKVKQLIEKDYESDEDDLSNDEDEDYKPNFDDQDSEDYSTATCSDIESQPRTPLATLMDEEGVFKRPLFLPTPKITVLNEPIATRSKKDLNDTPIEALQQPVFLDDPLDLPDRVEDEPWMEFLSDFQKPLDVIISDPKEGEETDPEYVCNEEFAEGGGYSANVPHREIEILLKDLTDEIEEQIGFKYAIPVEEDFLPPSVPKLLPLPPPHRTRTSIRVSTPEMPKDEEIVVKKPPEVKTEKKRPILKPVAVDPNYPMVQLPAGTSAVDVLLPSQPLPPNFQLIQGSNQRLCLPKTDNSLPYKSAVIPEFSKKEKYVSSYLKINLNDDWETILEQIHRQRSFYMNETTEIDGWSIRSLRVFHRQLMVHIQLVGQMFVQTFSHGGYWREASQYMSLLESLMESVTSSPVLSAFCWNLHEMFAVCKDWEAELSVISEDNQEYVRNTAESGLWQPRVMTVFARHRSFMFPEMLPRRPPVPPDNLKWNYGGCIGRQLLFILHLEDCEFRKQKRPKMKEMFISFVQKYGDMGNINSYKNMWKLAEVERYSRKGKLPEIRHRDLEFTSYDEVVPLLQRPKEEIMNLSSLAWRDFVLSKRKDGKREENLLSEVPAAPTDVPVVTMTCPTFKAEFKLPIANYFDIGDVIPGGEYEDEGQFVVDENANSTNDHDHSHHGEKERKPRGKRLRKRRVNIVQMIKSSLRKQKLLKKKPEIQRESKLIKRLYELLSQADAVYDNNVVLLEPNLISTKIFNYLKEFDTFAQLIQGKHQESQSRRHRRNRLQRLDTKEDVLSVDNDSLPTEPGTDFTKDSYFAWKYVKEVKMALGSQYHYFKEVLKMDTDSVVKFYLQIERLFVPQFNDLLKKFLVYLMPQHVSQLGLFFEDVINREAYSFQTKMDIYMSNREKLWMDIYDELNRLAKEESCPGMVSIKQRFLEILQDNPLIKQWFLKLFPSERVSPEKEDSGSMQFKGLGKRVVLPSELVTFLLKLVPEKAPTPPLVLRVSASEDDSDSVECLGEEVAEQHSCSQYSVRTAESDDTNISIGISTGEVMPHVLMEQSFESAMNYSHHTDGSDMDVIDYTE